MVHYRSQTRKVCARLRASPALCRHVFPHLNILDGFSSDLPPKKEKPKRENKRTGARGKLAGIEPAQEMFVREKQTRKGRNRFLGVYFSCPLSPEQKITRSLL